MSTQLVYKQVPIREPVLQNTLVFLVEAHLKLGLGYSSEISYCKVDFCNVYVELHQISMEIQATLEQEIIKLVRLSATEGVKDAGFSSLFISIRFRSLISIKDISKLTKYVG